MSELDDEVRALAEQKGFTMKPWEFHPAEVNAGPCPFNSDATVYWAQAQRLRAELVAEIEAARKPKRR